MEAIRIMATAVLMDRVRTSENKRVRTLTTLTLIP
jgi:hypothetical protein